ncbi:MAG: phytoene desaturase family protein [Calditrichia bacterium]
MKKKVKIIGAGLGALSAAIILSAQGYDVQVFEKNEQPGGKMNERKAAGFRWDTGPSLLTMSFVLSMLQQEAGVELKMHNLSIEPLTVSCRYFFPDGSCLDFESDPQIMSEKIEDFAPGEGKSFQRFASYSAKIYRHAAPLFLFTPFQELRYLLKPEHVLHFLHVFSVDPLRTMRQAIESFFRDKRLRDLFSRYATYNGSNPFFAPATLNIISHVENALGGFYIRNGMYRLIDHLSDIAYQMGVQFHLGQTVSKILHHDKKIKGIRVDSENLDADIVISNMDFMETHSRLLGSVPSRYNTLEPSLSGLVFLWGIKGIHHQLEHHNIFFPERYEDEFNDIFDRKIAPRQPTIYIAITSRKDRHHAPEGMENWFVLLNMPYLEEHQQWDEWIARSRSYVIDKLHSLVGLNASDIIIEETFNPQDFYNRYFSWKGSIYGLSSNHWKSAFLRPPNRSREFENLYFAGGSVHPGGGIPLTILSGIMTSRLILDTDKKQRR